MISTLAANSIARFEAAAVDYGTVVPTLWPGAYLVPQDIGQYADRQVCAVVPCKGCFFFSQRPQ